MGHSLSKDSQTVLEAAAIGDAELLKQHVSYEPNIVTTSVTLLKRRSVLHLAAKRGHSHVIKIVLQPLLEAVQEEYSVSTATPGSCVQFLQTSQITLLLACHDS
jgi:hypothetical protein